MEIAFAPLEGITGHVFRRVYHEFFDGVDVYYTPFIATNQKHKMRNKELNDILPEHNQGLCLIPQILGNNAADFVATANFIHGMGYDTVNLNLGCPSRTVVSKGKGSGFLAKTTELNRFLEEIYEKSTPKISIKTRLGKDDPEEFYELMKIFNQYPVEELIIHPRVQTDFYTNTPNWDIFEDALAESKMSVCYNGDIFSVEDFQRFRQRFPQVEKVMLGRGLLSYPTLAEQIREELERTNRAVGGCADVEKTQGTSEKSSKGCRDKKQEKEVLHQYICRLQEEYEKVLSGETPLLFKMKEAWGFLINSFQDGDKFRKKIHKSQRIADYEKAVEELFLTLDLKE